MCFNDSTENLEFKGDENKFWVRSQWYAYNHKPCFEQNWLNIDLHQVNVKPVRMPFVVVMVLHNIKFQFIINLFIGKNSLKDQKCLMLYIISRRFQLWRQWWCFVCKSDP